MFEMLVSVKENATSIEKANKKEGNNQTKTTITTTHSQFALEIAATVPRARSEYHHADPHTCPPSSPPPLAAAPMWTQILIMAQDRLVARTTARSLGFCYH